jgi:hypothetical protein
VYVAVVTLQLPLFTKSSLNNGSISHNNVTISRNKDVTERPACRTLCLLFEDLLPDLIFDTQEGEVSLNAKRLYKSKGKVVPVLN